MTNNSVYIHEFIDIIGANRANYMHHMTANWCPEAREQRQQLCFGVWGTVGSTGRWPEVVNLWELPGWDALVHDFRHELNRPVLQDPMLEQWWARAAEFRRGGFDRIVVPEPWSPTITELTAAGTRGELYAHELFTTAPGQAAATLQRFAEVGRDALASFGCTTIGAFRVAMVSDHEAILVHAIESWEAWAQLEQAWLGRSVALQPWIDSIEQGGTRLHRALMIDAPLSPLRIGRQPERSDRAGAPTA